MDAYQQIEQYIAKKYKSQAKGTKKAIGDFMLDEKHPVNVKSNNVEKNNYSPNIISAKRLLNWLRNDGNSLSFVFVDYKVKSDGNIEIIEDTGLVPIEHLCWSCLTIQAQGWGVIQLSAKLKINRKQDRAQFLKGLRQAYEIFIKKEEAKMTKIKSMIKGL